MSHVHAFHAYVPSSFYICYIVLLVLFWLSLSLPLSLFLALVASWLPNANLLRPRTLYVLGHLLPLILHPLPFGSMMKGPIRTSQKTFLDKAFIRNAKSSYRIFLMLTYPLSSTVGVGSGVAPRSPVPPWSYRSFTPICMDLILQYLSFLLAFEVRALWSLQILYLRCSMSQR